MDAVSRARDRGRAGRGGIAAAPDRGAPAWMPLALALAVCAAFANGVRGVFVFDDTFRIVDNPTLSSLWPPAVSGSLASRPILHLTLALNRAAGGLDPFGYHAVNIAIHAAASLVLFAILRRTLSGPRAGPRIAAKAPRLAFAIALLWALHPLQTQSVTYIVQRGESLASLLCLLALHAAIRAADGPRRVAWTAAAVGASALAMATKELAVTLPVLVALYDRAFLYPSAREMLRRRAALYVGLALTALLPVALVARVPGGEATGFVEGLRPIAPARYLASQAPILVHYLRLALWPDPLVLDYQWRPVESVREALPQGICLLSLLGASAWATVRRHPLGYLGAFFFVVLAPTSSVIPIADLAFEHRMYLPLAAVACAVVLGADSLLDRIARPRPGDGRARVLPWAALVLAAAALAAATVRRNEDYRSLVSIWSDTVRERPLNQRAHLNLGISLEKAGREEEAFEHYREAVRLAPDYPGARVNYGLALVRRGRIEEGVEHYRAALKIEPDDPIAHFDLGMAHKLLGRREEALASFAEALRLDPRQHEAQNQSGIVLFDSGRNAEAAERFRAAIRIRPAFPEALHNLGLALYRLGRREEAEARFLEALALRPDYAEAHNNLGVLLHQRGEVAEAIGHFAEAVRLKPDYADASRNLGNARKLLEQERPGR